MDAKITYILREMSLGVLFFAAAIGLIVSAPLIIFTRLVKRLIT